MNLNLIGPITEQIGYGIHFTNLVRELSSLCSCSIYPIGSVDQGVDLGPIKDQAFDPYTPTIIVQPISQLWRFDSTLRIGYTIFESNRVAALDMDILDRLDAIFVPSEWAKDVMNTAHCLLYDKTEVVPEGVNTDIFSYHPEKWTEFGTKDNPLKVVSVGKFESRKNQKELLEALELCAPYIDKDEIFVEVDCFWDNHWNPNWHSEVLDCVRTEDVSDSPNPLHIYTYGKDSSIFSSLKNHLRIKVYRKWSSPSSYVKILREAHIGIFPYSAEGWCLPLLEAMSCGVVCVATNYSGPTEYLTETNSILIPVTSTIEIPSCYGTSLDSTWAYVDSTELYEILCPLLTGKIAKDTLLSISAEARKTALEYTWKKSAEKTLEAVKSLIG